eukprot:298920-Chlamydomonas_euryale.AAC.5
MHAPLYPASRMNVPNYPGSHMHAPLYPETRVHAPLYPKSWMQWQDAICPCIGTQAVPCAPNACVRSACMRSARHLWRSMHPSSMHAGRLPPLPHMHPSSMHVARPPRLMPHASKQHPCGLPAASASHAGPLT